MLRMNVARNGFRLGGGRMELVGQYDASLCCAMYEYVKDPGSRELV